MKPVSTASFRPPSGTRWVSAWPPSRSSASNSVTWAVREATYAATRPATPEPTTATRSGIERDERDDVVARLGRRRAGLLDGDAGPVRRGSVAVEHDRVVRAGRHDAGGHHLVAVLEPQDVVVAGGGGRHVPGDDRRLVELLRAVDRGAAAVAQGHLVALDVAGCLDLLDLARRALVVHLLPDDAAGSEGDDRGSGGQPDRRTPT